MIVAMGGSGGGGSGRRTRSAVRNVGMVRGFQGRGDGVMRSGGKGGGSAGAMGSGGRGGGGDGGGGEGVRPKLSTPEVGPTRRSWPRYLAIMDNLRFCVTPGEYDV